MFYINKIRNFIKKHLNEKRENTLNFRKIDDISYLIRNNLKKIPDDIDLVVGIPRSGIIPAYIIALFINKNVCSLNEFTNNIVPTHGDRIVAENNNSKQKILIVDDSICTGNAISKVKEQLSQMDKDKYEFIYLTIFATKESQNKIDIFFETVEQPRMFQWNYLNHCYANKCCYDMDGVLCVDPTPEENDDGEKYLDFIKNAKPLFIPNYTINSIVTSRLEKYRIPTENWLKQHNVKYKNLYMLNLPNQKERLRLGCHAEFKAKIFKKLKNCSYFIESDANQAKIIAKLSKKLVICVESDELYK